MNRFIIIFFYKYAVYISMFSAGLWCISHFMRAVADFSLNNILFSFIKFTWIKLTDNKIGKQAK